MKISGKNGVESPECVDAKKQEKVDDEVLAEKYHVPEGAEKFHEHYRAPVDEGMEEEKAKLYGPYLVKNGSHERTLLFPFCS